MLPFTQCQLGLTPGWTRVVKLFIATHYYYLHHCFQSDPASVTLNIVDVVLQTLQPFSMQSVMIGDVRFSVHYVFLPVHCWLRKHCWTGFNQAQWEGMGLRLRNPGIVMYWHCRGLSVGMHATGWHSSLIQCCCHMGEGISLQQYQIQPTSHHLEFRCNRHPLFVCQRTLTEDIHFMAQNKEAYFLWFSYKLT